MWRSVYSMGMQPHATREATSTLNARYVQPHVVFCVWYVRMYQRGQRGRKCWAPMVCISVVSEGASAGHLNEPTPGAKVDQTEPLTVLPGMD